MVKHTSEKLKAREGLIKRHFMAGLVNSEEAEVAVLAHLAVFLALDNERNVACLGKLGLVGKVELLGDGFTAKPIADVIGVAIEETNADTVVDDNLEVVDKDWVSEVAGASKRVVNVTIGFRVVQIHAQGLLNLG